MINAQFSMFNKSLWGQTGNANHGATPDCHPEPVEGSGLDPGYRMPDI
jgi:hypothetical protein